jgi:hypothetical protein
MIKILEWSGTGFGLAGSLALATIGAQPALLLFSVSSMILLATAKVNQQHSFVLLQGGFLFCNALGIVKLFW